MPDPRDINNANAGNPNADSAWGQAQHYDGTDRAFRQTNAASNPVEWLYGAASGGDFSPLSQGGHDFYGNMYGGGSVARNANQIAWQPSDELVYKQMDQNQWAELSRKQPDSQRAWIETRKRWLLNGHDDNGNPVKPGVFWNPQTGKTEGSQAASAAAPGGAGGTPGYSQQLQDFYRMMMDPNAPELKAAQAQGVNAGQRSFGGAGIRGGLSSAGILKAGMDARNQTFNQRAQLGLNALSTGSSRELSQNEMALRAQGQFFDQNQSTDINAANQKRAQEQKMMALGGQVASGFLQGGRGGGGGGASGFTPGGQNTPSFDAGNIGGDGDTSWSSPY